MHAVPVVHCCYLLLICVQKRKQAPAMAIPSVVVVPSDDDDDAQMHIEEEDVAFVQQYGRRLGFLEDLNASALYVGRGFEVFWGVGVQSMVLQHVTTTCTHMPWVSPPTRRPSSQQDTHHEA